MVLATTTELAVRRSYAMNFSSGIGSNCRMLDYFISYIFWI